MPEYSLILPFSTCDLSEKDGRQMDDESTDSPTTAAGYPPAPAQCFHVRSLQHWIDLCA
jgi:hypothetical protein